MSRAVAEEAVPLNRIKILPDRVVNQIAAGEVVERPASVVKELVENSLDAGARRVFVSIRNGGKSYLEVADDGIGMSRDDAILAFERHATSKIRDADDLMSVATLGFRGEALAAISSVSRTLLSVCQHGAAGGAEVTVEGGRLTDSREGPPIPGARIQVRDLFFNAPARRKFLRSERSEAERVEEVVVRLAIARPDVSFTFVKDGKPELELPALDGDDVWKKRIEGVFGEKFSSGLIPVSFSLSGLSIAGFISRPGHNLDGAGRQYVYLNGRLIRDRLVSLGVTEGYHSLLPRGARPAYVLFLTVPQGQVDVNVHPAKMEVRFRDGRDVVGLVKSAVLNALISIKNGSSAREAFHTPAVSGTPHDAPISGDPWMAPAPPSSHRPFREPVSAMLYETAQTDLAKDGAVRGALDLGEGAIRSGADMFETFDGSLSPDVRVVGQLFKSFIVAEDGDRTLLLDQHTVHERILRERISSRLESGGVESQELLFPFEIEIPVEAEERVEDSLPILEKLGFTLTQFGSRSYAVRSAPALLAGKDPRQTAMEIVRLAYGPLAFAGTGRILEESVNVMACRGAVKAGQSLDKREMESLLSQLAECVLPYTCPHGRPVAVVIHRESLLKAFLRK
ncbi:MAG: DNA mismatch repair endonuclease MutL [Nitrospinae bacterium]|nr:DNA mismatch repair endonuclease MutL [Nitrospinota bacterium]MBF0633703.1 DNA mismatch repair endonuclease MutL [Nitrospinota bacterium]